MIPLFVPADEIVILVFAGERNVRLVPGARLPIEVNVTALVPDTGASIFTIPAPALGLKVPRDRATPASEVFAYSKVPPAH